MCILNTGLYESRPAFGKGARNAVRIVPLPRSIIPPALFAARSPTNIRKEFARPNDIPRYEPIRCAKLAVSLLSQGKSECYSALTIQARILPNAETIVPPQNSTCPNMKAEPLIYGPCHRASKGNQTESQNCWFYQFSHLPILMPGVTPVHQPRSRAIGRLPYRAPHRFTAGLDRGSSGRQRG